MKLPPADFTGKVALERTIKQRRTIRSFSSAPLTLKQFAQLLWAAYGTTDDRGFMRAVPSAGALYPMDIYAVVGTGGIETIQAGIHHYEPRKHTVVLLGRGDFRNEISKASLFQTWMAVAPLMIVITAEYDRITGRYGDRGIRYAIMESGHIAQNIFLQAEALGLGAGIVGAFNDRGVNRVMNIPSSHEPLLIMPVGYKQQ
ncbi:MAG: SagB/ThcOx family dehydrogenase [Deltaproteobacteria bacterium]|nr:SagB/ThcOx family dehydrogenase [Deltaproteobacteria bacterium]